MVSVRRPKPQPVDIGDEPPTVIVDDRRKFTGSIICPTCGTLATSDVCTVDGTRLGEA